MSTGFGNSGAGTKVSKNHYSFIISLFMFKFALELNSRSAQCIMTRGRVSLGNNFLNEISLSGF
jgi:hypothetical protein